MDILPPGTELLVCLKTADGAAGLCIHASDDAAIALKLDGDRIWIGLHGAEPADIIVRRRARPVRPS